MKISSTINSHSRKKPTSAREPLPTNQDQNPFESWSPLLIGSSLGATIGAGVSATSLGSGLKASLVGFGVGYLSAKALGISRYGDVGLLMYSTAMSASAAAAWSAGPAGLAILAGGAIAALATERFLQ